MKTAPPGLALLDPMELLVGCRTESDRSIAGTLVANHTSNFSAWSEPVSLGPAINTPGFNDQQAVLSKDGLSLYFASNRPSALGTQSLLAIGASRRACADARCPWDTTISPAPTANR